MWIPTENEKYGVGKFTAFMDFLLLYFLICIKKKKKLPVLRCVHSHSVLTGAVCRMGFRGGELASSAKRWIFKRRELLFLRRVCVCVCVCFIST